jgi:CRISPR-associated protein Cas1
VYQKDERETGLSKGTDPKRNVCYPLTEQGSKLRKTSEGLVVEKNGETVLEVPAFGIDCVLVFGNVQLSTQAISFLLENGIDVNFLSMSGKFKGKLVPVESKNIFLKQN